MTYQEAIQYIHSVSWTFCKPGLERITSLCRALGNPQKDLQFVHVAGTNGKGSFCAMLDSILRAEGYRVGLFTSPYIRFFNERICVGGKPISDEELAEVTTAVKPYADAMTDRPTEFELITAIALEYFRRKECQVVILEAGMGGRLDSTNLIRNPILSVITGIALDHTAYLGDTVEQIAAEKAGIIKDQAPVLYGGQDIAAEQVIRERAKEKGSAFNQTDYRRLLVREMTLEGSRLDFEPWQNLTIPLLGAYQPRNAAVVLSAVELLRRRGWNVSDEAVREGLRGAIWHGRFEILSRDPLLIFDGAHNPQGIAAATESIRRYFPEGGVHVLTGVLRDKDYEAIAESLSSVAVRACTITPDNPRALPAEEYAEVLRRKGIEATPCECLTEGLRKAREGAKKAGAPLFCLGSLYLYADLFREL